MLKHLLIISAITLFISILYSKVTGAYFCSYDDFNEMHRAVFEDTHQPLHILTTSHFNSYKYRPLNRAITLLTYSVGDGSPFYFRVRNLLFHLLNVVLVYRISWLLFKNILISGVGAALFGLHPLVNQSVIGAVWTNTIAHTFFLLSLLMFIISMRSQRLHLCWLAASLVSAWLSLFIYDSGITVYFMMIISLIIHLLFYRERALNWQFVGMFTVGSIVLIGSPVLLRIFFVRQGWGQASTSIPSLGVIVKNIGMYCFALLLPIDSILANEWLHIPLPSEIALNISKVVIIGVWTFAIILFMTLTIWRYMKIKKLRLYKMDWAHIVFLICGIFTPLLPVLLLSSHPSETYLYLPVVFYMLFLSYGLTRLLAIPKVPRSQSLYIATILILLFLFGAATWVRNDRVNQCGEIVHRILSSLPNELLTNGKWMLSFANVPGEQLSRRYGFYGFRGIDTIGDGSMANGAISSALQLVFKNGLITGEIVTDEELTTICNYDISSRHLCLRVHSDGEVDEFQ